MKYIDIKEFREKGYLQELNRRFLHPLGLALEVQIDDGNEILGGIWDYRDDEEGILYDIENSDENRIKKFNTNKEFIDNEILLRSEIRNNILGSIIESIPKNKL